LGENATRFCLFRLRGGRLRSLRTTPKGHL
jgi:hypothetical protein